MTFHPIRTVAPQGSVVSLEQLLAHLRVDELEANADLADKLAAATQLLDGHRGLLGRCLLTQTWTQRYEGWPCERRLVLPFPDVSVVTVTYLDPAHQVQTLAPEGYSSPAEGPGGSLIDVWPETLLPALSNRPGPVTVTLTAGYGTAQQVPLAIVQALLLMVGAMEGGQAASDAARLPAVESLLAPHRAHWGL